MAQPPITPKSGSKSASAHQSSQASSYQTSEQTYAHILYPHSEQVLDQATVMTPDEFLTDTFGPNASDIVIPDGIKDVFKNTIDTIPDKKNSLAVGKAEKKEAARTEARMYEPLVKGFNKCCKATRKDVSVSSSDYVPEQDLQCVNVHSFRYDLGGTSSIASVLGPDLFLTFDHENIQQSGMKTAEGKTDEDNDGTKADKAKDASYSPSKGKSDDHLCIFTVPGITVEVKRSSDDDFGRSSSKKPSDFAKSRLSLIAQSLTYVLHAQWPKIPYRFVFAITIAGEHLRIWRFSTTGAVVTDAIDYTNDASPVYKFIQIVGSGPYSRLGVDIGLGCTFTGVTRNSRSKVDEIVQCYRCSVLTTSQLEVIQNGGTADVSSDLQYWLSAVGSAMLLEFVVPDASYQSPILKNHTVPQARCGEKQNIHFYVLSIPISSLPGLFGRGSRCYLVIRKESLSAQHTITIKDLHTLKTSWQFIVQHPEIGFFEKAQGSDPNSSIPYLATVLAGGSIASTRQHGGHFVSFNRHDECIAYTRTYPAPFSNTRSSSNKTKSLENPQTAWDFFKRTRELQFIIMEEVGGRLKGSRSIPELVTVLGDAMSAHERLVSKGVLHRDISEGNVMINLNGRRGLLIDLDIAMLFDQPSEVRNLQQVVDAILPFESTRDDQPYSGDNLYPPEQLYIAGTLMFQSIALREEPEQKSWHDAEAFFYLFVWMLLRQSKMGVVEHDSESYNLEDESERDEALDALFPESDDEEKEAKYLAVAKLELLQEGRFTFSEDPSLTALVETVRERFKAIYTSFSAMIDIQAKLISLDSATQKTAKRDFYSVKDVSEIMEIFKKISTAAEPLVQKKGTNTEPLVQKNGVTSKSLRRQLAIAELYLDGLQPFPDISWMKQCFEEYLAKPSGDQASESEARRASSAG